MSAEYRERKIEGRETPAGTVGQISNLRAIWNRARFLAVVYLSASTAFAATTTLWEMTGYQDFLKGKLSGVSVTRDGRIIAGPKFDVFFTSDQQQIWSIAQGPDGSIYAGTGDRGKLLKIDTNGRGSVLWTADQPEVFAVAIDRAGIVYAGTSPEGKVYRIENGRATEYFSPGEPYIWALAFAPDGALYVATGQQGKIFRVTAAGKGELYYETGQAHVTALAFDSQGRVLAGSEPNGIVYRIAGTPAKGFVLYDANLPEIRTILPMPDGTIYAGALGGSVARRTGAATTSTTSTTPTVTAPATSITVTDAQSAIATPPKPEAPKATAATPATTAAVTTTEVTGIEKSALYRISADNTVETVWTSKEENLYDFLPAADGAMLLLTDAQGRIYTLDARANGSRSAVLLAQTNESDPTRLLATRAGTLAAVGSAGKLLRFTTAPSTGGSFESPVHDSGAVARWGRLSWVGTNTGISFKTRSGNSARPDATWSDWSAPITDPSKAEITSPNARYIQWRVEFSSTTSEVDGVSIAYLPQNSAPTVRSITVSSLASGSSKSATATGGSSSAFSITVTDVGEASTPAGTQTQTLTRPPPQQVQIIWQADDPEGDKLSYDVFFRGDEEREWKLLKANVAENTYLVDSDTLADGRYVFRVVASDRPSNAPAQARQAELASAPVLIDNTPPQVTAGTPRRNGTTLEIQLDAEDRASALRRCEYAIDGQSPWQPVEAVDGITDATRERFVVGIPNFPAGEHVVVVRVYDAAGNAGLARVVVR
ncbi:MAG: WD40 repeat domain-containing protein [Bryobacteraceae bacterium]